MALNIAAPFKRGGAFPIDEDLVLTKAQMKAVNDNVMPDIYIALCPDDGNIYLYKKNNTVDPDTGKYRLFESGSGSGEMGEDFTTNIDVGGIKAGTAIEDTDTVASVIKRMLVTTYYPKYTAPSASLSYGAGSLAKVGSTIQAMAGTVSYNAGAITLQNQKQADRGGAATKFYLSTSGAATEFSEENTTGSFTVGALTRATKGNITLTGKVDYAEGPQPKDSDGKNYETPLAAGSVTATKTIKFILPFYWGKSQAESISDLTGFTEDLTEKVNKQYTYQNAGNDYCYIIYDAAYGPLKSILDENNFENLGSWIQRSLTVDEQSYFVYRSKWALTGTFPFTFKF